MGIYTTLTNISKNKKGSYISQEQECQIIVLVYFLGTSEKSKNQVNKGLFGQYLVVYGNEKHKI